MCRKRSQPWAQVSVGTEPDVDSRVHHEKVSIQEAKSMTNETQNHLLDRTSCHDSTRLKRFDR